MKIDVRSIFDEKEKSMNGVGEAAEAGHAETDRKPMESVTVKSDDELPMESVTVKEPEPVEVSEEPTESEHFEAVENPAEPEPVAVREEPETSAKQHLRRYGAVYGCALIMLLLTFLTFVYTTMIPRTIYAQVDGERITIVTEAYTIDKALEQAGIEYCDEDYLSEFSGAFVHDNMSLELIHATNYKVTADGETRDFKSLADTVQEALDEEGISVGEIDIVKPGLSAELKEGMKIVIKRVVIEKKTVSETVKYKTEVKEDSSLAEGTEKVQQKGKNGKDKVTYEITYIDGREKSRREISRETVEKSEKEIILKGTAVEYNGKLYRKKLTVKAYSYTGGGRTASGTKARVGEIAVDPRVIPLGTVVYIPGIGERRAEDTGGNIKGNTIDIYMSSLSACRKWGCRTITIYIK